MEELVVKLYVRIKIILTKEIDLYSFKVQNDNVYLTYGVFIHTVHFYFTKVIISIGRIIIRIEIR